MTGANETPLGVNNRPDPTPKPVAAAPPTNASTQANNVRKQVEAKVRLHLNANDKYILTIF